MVFNNDKSYILRGEDYYKPLPEESVGIQIYETLKNAEDQERVIFVDSGTDAKLTVRDFLEKTTKLACALQNGGFKKGDIVGICSENNLSYYQPVVASLYLGFVATPISFHYTEYELNHVVEICKPKIVFCTKTTVTKYLSLKEKLNFIERIVLFDNEVDHTLKGVEYYEDFIGKYCGENYKTFQPIDLNGDDLAVLLSSSGTTGLPKCVMISHRNTSSNIVRLSDPRYIKQVPNGVYFGVLPFYHAFGFQTVINHLTKLTKIVVMKKFVDVEFLSAIERYKINILWLVPPLLVFMAKSPLVKKYDLSHIVEVISAAAPLGKDIEKRILEILNLDRVVQGYGLTETTLATLIVPTTSDKFKQGSCGKILPGLSVKVRSPETGLLMKANEVGELCFKGNAIMQGYYNNPVATKSTIDEDGWLSTGDLGYYDEDGYFFIVDRLKELIKYKGFQVAPAEVEALLLTHPKIKDVGIVGKKDLDAGEVCVGFVVPNGEITEEEVKEFVAVHLSRPKHLHGGVRLVKEIPRAASGKILRRILREQVAE